MGKSNKDNEKEMMDKRREILINRLQGNEETPFLSVIRKDLGIETTVEFANILGVTRPTISRLESTKMKLTSVQYLAICSLIEGKKRKILNKLINKERISDNEIFQLGKILYLFDSNFYIEMLKFLPKKISVKYEKTSSEFNVDIDMNEMERKAEIIFQQDNIKKYVEKNLKRISQSTCMDSWMNTINSDEQYLINNFDRIVIMYDNLENLSDLINEIRNKLYYKIIYLPIQILYCLEEALKNKEEKNENIPYNIMDFTYYLSQILKKNTIELYDFEKIIQFDALFAFNNNLYLIENEDIGKTICGYIKYIINIMQSHCLPIGGEFMMKRIQENYYLNDFLIYENGSFKRTIVDDIDIEKSSKYNSFPSFEKDELYEINLNEINGKDLKNKLNKVIKNIMKYNEI